MRRCCSWLFVAALGLVPFGRAEEPKAVEVTLRGEVVDLHCYLTREAKGREHAGCANACLSRGVSAGLLAEDGRLYVLLAEKPVSVKDAVAGLAGEPVVVEGTLVERAGYRAVKVKAARRS